MRRLGRKSGLAQFEDDDERKRLRKGSRRIHPHQLRHSRVVELALENVPIHVIQRILGHKNVSTTYEYLNHLIPIDVRGYMVGEAA